MLFRSHPDLSGEAIYEAYRDYDARVGLPQRASWRAHGNAREAGKRLKVGYVSPDFRRHSARHFLEPVLANHDHSRHEIYAYAELGGGRRERALPELRGSLDSDAGVVG